MHRGSVACLYCDQSLQDVAISGTAVALCIGPRGHGERGTPREEGPVPSGEIILPAVGDGACKWEELGKGELG